MIIKNFELKKINLKDNKYFLLYGNNEGLIEETIEEILKPNLSKNIYNYEESDILKNIEDFKENLLNKSFFENEKLIIIKRISDKFFKIIEELVSKNIEDLSIILVASNLDKRSKIRVFFEKEKNTTCVPFYEDNAQALSFLAKKFLKDKNINISQQLINIIIERAKGDRINLKNELQKIESFSENKKNISIEDILKITNLSENYEISDLIDNCLSKNKKKVIKIINENNFSNEDCIIIIRSFIIKAKRLLILSKTFETNQNIDLTISSAKPPIFWKEKETTKQQIYKWKPKNVKKLIYLLSETELLIKKNINNSINLVTDFILLQSSLETNN
jgi:DNA polymerase-3 subunit delta